MFNFLSKPDPKDEQRKNTRALRKASRDSDREFRKLEAAESKLILDIKNAARANQNDYCKILAKQLVDLRKQKSRFKQASSRIQSVESQSKMAETNTKLASIVGDTSKTLGDMNKVMDPVRIGTNLKDFSEASMKLDMADELINENLDDMLAGSDDDEQMDQVMSQVLDEIGIEINDKVSNIPNPKNKLSEPSASTSSSSSSQLISDDDILKKLEKLQS